jgi:hypothetical protein
MIGRQFGPVSAVKHDFYRPFRAGSFRVADLGLKPQAESLSPFGTNFEKPPRDKILRCIHIGQEIIYPRLRRRLRFLNRAFNLIVDFFLNTIEIVQIRVTTN